MQVERVWDDSVSVPYAVKKGRNEKQAKKRTDASIFTCIYLANCDRAGTGEKARGAE
jgi:hypothetical protein